MEANDLQRLYHDLNTPHVADAIMRLGLPVRQAAAYIAPLWEGTHLVGRALPAQHAGSVDVFLEAFELSRPGDVLVVDNGGRDDEACVGDLVTLEAAQAALAGIVIWGLHRDPRTARHPPAHLQSGHTARRPPAAGLAAEGRAHECTDRRPPGDQRRLCARR